MQKHIDDGLPTKQRVRASALETRFLPRWARVARALEAHVVRVRSYRCPRCIGGGVDPEQPPMGNYPDPPDPCGLCNGYGYISPWSRA